MFFRLLYHINWATKMREPTIEEEIEQSLYDYLRGKSLELGGMVLAIGGTHNHVHLVLSIPPTLAVSDFVRRLKGASSHWVNHKLKPGGTFAWQSGYAAFTLADSLLERIKTYVENQKLHHANGRLNKALERNGDGVE